jgi:hypothetical protein
MNGMGRVLHTYPILLADADEAASDSEYEKKALEAAAHGRLVPDPKLVGLTARMHISRSGQLQPYGDRISTTSETMPGLEQEVRERAYLLWEQDGRPEGQSDEYWARSLDQHLRERAYVLWQQEGKGDGGANADWDRMRDFQAR